MRMTKKRNEGEEEEQEAGAEGGVEVHEEQYVTSGVGILKLSVFVLL